MFQKGVQQAARLVLLALLVTSPAVAAGHGPKPAAAVAQQDHGSLWAWAWQWVQALWGEEGACIDPNGKCLKTTTAPPVHTDAGAQRCDRHVA